MAPRKKPAADEHCPSLTLVMQKGPLSGQTNHFGPQARIHIGRVARGNTLSIKDAGVSSKHLSFQTETLTDAQRRCWTVADLASSNGTFLNGVKLAPNQPTPLSDADVVKIGEQTSILVNLVVDGGGEIEVGRNPRRNARRGVKKLGVIDEESELGLGETNLGVRVKSEDDVNWEDDEKMEGVSKVSSRRTRKSKKDKDLDFLIDDVDEDEEAENREVIVAEVKRGTNVGMRKTRSSKKDDNLSKDLIVEEEKDLETRVSVRRTRSSRKEEITSDSVIDLSVIEGRRTRKGTRGRKNQTLETPLGETEKDEVNEVEERKSEAEVNELVETGRENSTAFAGTSVGAREGGAVEDGHREVAADLEKMTLGEWFDFLEVYLPKQIIDETEEMISEMRRKAERLHEFMVQHKKAIKTGDVAME